MDRIKRGITELLRKLEKYTKTDMVYIAQGGFWLGIGQVISTGAAFITSLAFANLLAPEVFGIYKYVLSLSGMISVTTLTGMDSALSQAVARGFEGTLSSATKEKIKWGLLGSLASISVAVYYLIHGNEILAISFGIVAIFNPFSEALDIYNSFLLGKKLFSTQTLYSSIKRIISTAAIISTIFLTHNVYIILFVYFSSTLLPNILFYFRTKKLNQSNTNAEPEAIKYGKHLSAINIIGMVLGELDKILVFQLVGATNLAVYSLATAPTEQIKGLFKNVNALAFPKFAGQDIHEIKKSIYHKALVLLLSTSLVVGVYVLIAPWFFNLFFPKYLASIAYSQALAISLIAAIIAGFLYTALESQKAKAELYKYNTYSNIFNVIILVPFVFYFGIWGAVITRSFTRLFTLVLAFFLVRNTS